VSCTFALGGPQFLGDDDILRVVASKRLPAGSWAVVATVNTIGADTSSHSGIDVACELRNGANIIGGASDRRPREGGELDRRTLTMVGGAQVPEGGGDVSVLCRANGSQNVESCSMMMFQVGNFF
jgi:hypothetical protein